jgi:Derlin-2/3
MQMSFLGLFTFNAPYLPFTLIAFTVILHSQIPWADFIGMIVGHTYYFLEDVYPTLSTSQRSRPLKAPVWFVNLFSSQDNQLEVLPDLQMEQLAENVDGNGR